ncbi:hypothetical protein PVAP13_8KG400101 [Panicum virgatum]|uniref:Reverse transcriptase zinc-binding domain-containing protein n=1 Tax=Panicum virgatum TaxID=38727 RepID=A0A8T0PUS5_PANVG|nr:hypothetical protein PVAP13_8KG400101 [Panicum virgatum]
MLGKQGWRLLTRPDSLCTRVIKGKYSPHGNFLSATRRKRSSETWHALLHGRDVLRRGLIKRVGPGNSINIWNDNWIPGALKLKPLLRQEHVIVEQVDELFIQGTRRWNEDLVRDSFVPWDAEEILKIKAGVRMVEDTVAWNYERTGIYSVRSAYRLLKADERQKEASAGNKSGSSYADGIWNKLWKLKIPPKIRIFWWRAVNNFLPTKRELKRRHVEQEDFCETCGEEGETLFHVAFKCPLARRFWQSAKDLVGIKIPALHPATWTRDLLSPDKVLNTDAAMIICGVWSLWAGRNARKHGRVSWNSGAAVRHISKMLEDLVCSSTTQEVRPDPLRRR